MVTIMVVARRRSVTWTPVNEHSVNLCKSDRLTGVYKVLTNEGIGYIMYASHIAYQKIHKRRAHIMVGLKGSSINVPIKIPAIVGPNITTYAPKISAQADKYAWATSLKYKLYRRI